MADPLGARREENEGAPRPVVGNVFERQMGLAAQLAAAVDAKGSYYPSHSQGVEQIARSIAETMHFPPDRVARVALAALLHDVGKLLVPDQILLKPTLLTTEEFAVMRGHAADGERVLVAAGYGDEALWVRHHHERFDGTGYPDGLAGDAISIEARIVCVADACHAMQADRPYRRARSIAWALSELGREAESQFCPAVVRAVQSMALTR
jgi:HD-GYP domain-containing protein (c-di-GMP phosphodiesterase class II)